MHKASLTTIFLGLEDVRWHHGRLPEHRPGESPEQAWQTGLGHSVGNSGTLVLGGDPERKRGEPAGAFPRLLAFGHEAQGRGPLCPGLCAILTYSELSNPVNVAGANDVPPGWETLGLSQLGVGGTIGI